MKCDLCNGSGQLNDNDHKLKCWKCKGKGIVGWVNGGQSFIYLLFDLALLTFLFCGGVVSLHKNQGVVTLYWWAGFGVLVATNICYMLLAIR